MMYPQVVLAHVAKPVSRPVVVTPGRGYRTLGVKLWGEGVYERDTIDGSETAARTLNVVRRDDLIINKIWVRHGSAAVVPPHIDGCAGSGEFPTFELDWGLVLPRWLHWLTKTRGFWNACAALSRGTSGKDRIRPERFLSIEVPLPPLEEQRRVVASIERLSRRVDDLLGLTRAAAEEVNGLVGYLTSRLYEQFGSFPEVQLGTLGNNASNPIQTGPFGAQLHSSEFTEAGVPVLNVGNVTPQGLDQRLLDFVTPEKAEQLARYRLKPHDLLFARTGATLGKVCLVPEGCNDWLMTGHLFRVRLDSGRCYPPFAFTVLRGASAVREQVFGQVRGATRPGFNTTLLSQVRLRVPPLPAQRAFVQAVDAVNSRVEAYKRVSTERNGQVDALLPSILDKAFKGEL